jgi:N-acetylglutamate synthase
LSHLTPADVGRRVTVRRRIDGRTGPMSDVVGRLVAWSDQQLVLRRADGSTTSIQHEAIVAARVVPAARADVVPTVAELQEIAARGWRSPDSTWVGRWWLRAAGGFTGRANSALPLGSPQLPLEAALSIVVRWYEERGLTARFLLEIGASLDYELVTRGWVEPKKRYGAVLVQTAPLAPAILALSALTDPKLPPVTTHSTPSDAWLASYRDGAALHRPARAVLADHPRVRFAELHDDGGLVAIGRVAVDERWAGISAVVVEPAARRRGIATAVVRSLFGQAWELGARRAYLQVEEDNDAAIRLYERIGFTTHHRYHYLVPGSSSS